MVAPNKLAPALCLDLDGTVRHSKSGEFINGPEDVALFDGVEEKIWQYRDRGWLIFGITNQGGVAYGFKTPLDNDAELDAMIALFLRGSPFHIIKSCYHHGDGEVEPYCHRSLLRKPNIGMLAICEVDARDGGYIVDWDRSLFVGDRPEDEKCAQLAGIDFEWANVFFGREVSHPGTE
jgi:D-glycero-D-manno-heptose 1,7-bisphosphate phosphatase